LFNLVIHSLLVSGRINFSIGNCRQILLLSKSPITEGEQNAENLRAACQPELAPQKRIRAVEPPPAAQVARWLSDKVARCDSTDLFHPAP
jgi:hypothetical protein